MERQELLYLQKEIELAKRLLKNNVPNLVMGCLINIIEHLIEELDNLDSSLERMKDG